MRCTFSHRCAVLASLFFVSGILGGVAAAPAQTSSSIDLSRLDALEAEVAQLRQQVYGNAGSDGDSGQDWFYVGGELGLIRPQTGFIATGYGLTVAPRAWIGHENADGLGLRVGAWYIDSTMGLSQAPLQVDNRLAAFTVDLDVTQRLTLRSWDLQAFGGVRIAGLQSHLLFDVVDGPSGALNYDFISAGPTIGFAFNRDLGDNPWSCYGSFRGSLLFGGSSIDLIGANLPVGNSIPLVDQLVSVLDVRFGMQYSRPTDFGAWYARFGVEGQSWLFPPIALGIGDANIGFFGPTLSFGLEF